MPRALILFSGTDSVGRYLREKGWETVTLDWDKRMTADICESIHAWDHTVFPPGHFDFVQASPDCTEWSPAITCRPRDIPKAKALVERTLESSSTSTRPGGWKTLGAPRFSTSKTS